MSKNFFFHSLCFNFEFVLKFLTLGSIFFGFIFFEYFIGLGNFSFYNSLFFLESNDCSSLLSAEFLVYYLKLLPFFLGIISKIFLSYYLLKFNYFKYFFNKKIFTLFFFFSEKWYFDLIYNKYVSNFIFFLSYQLIIKSIDKGLLEVFGVFSFKFFVKILSFFFSRLHLGVLYHYCLFLLLEVFSKYPLFLKYSIIFFFTSNFNFLIKFINNKFFI